jgi:hypothetical protein
MAGPAFRSLVLFHPRLVQVPSALGQLLPCVSFKIAEELPVVVVIVLDDLECPATRDDVSAQQFGFEPIGDGGVPGLPQRFDRVAQLNVGGAGQLVEGVEVPAGAFAGLQGLGQLSECFHRLVADTTRCGVALVRQVFGHQLLLPIGSR